MAIEQYRERRLFVLLLSTIVLFVGAVAATSAANQDDSSDQKFSGAWIGSYTGPDGVGGDLKFNLRKEEKAEWQGKLTFRNQDGEHTLELKPLQIASGKLKAKAENGDMEIAIEGALHGDQLEGTYSVKPAGATDVVETGTWKVAKESAAKP